MLHEFVHKLFRFVFRNGYTISSDLADKKKVNLEYWKGKINIGDQLSRIIVEWMLEKHSLTLSYNVKKTCHLMALGSIFGCGFFDATVWGSGVNTPISIYRTGRWRKRVNYDIRAVRGPITKKVLESFGYDCSKVVLGDPGVLMPFIYEPENIEKKYDVSIIKHFSNKEALKDSICKYHNIDVETSDYKLFINEISASKIIVSSSLHGIILAESYGIPAIFLNENGIMDKEIVKYYDWYYSTGRKSVACANSIEEALKMQPMKLPELDNMRQGLMACFPYDLWEN